MKVKYLRWQAPGNGKIFDAPLGEISYMNSRSLAVLEYISKRQSVSQSQFEREIKEYLEEQTEYIENNSTPAHFFRPLLFLGFLKMSSNRVLELTLEGDKFLYHYKEKNFLQCKEYILNQLDNTKYPNEATKKVTLQIFPFRILLKMLVDEEKQGVSKEFVKYQLPYINSYDDMLLYIKEGNLEKIAKYEMYDKFYTWVLNSLVDIEILKVENGHFFLQDEVYEYVKRLYDSLSYESFFFQETTLLCQLDNKTAYQRYKRDAKLIQEAKVRDSFSCAIDKEHFTFISKGQPYVEGHHAVPMFQQKNYEFTIDDVDNIISLCPNCHREVHSADEKNTILQKVYQKSEAFMVKNSISLNEFYKMYYCA